MTKPRPSRAKKNSNRNTRKEILAYYLATFEATGACPSMAETTKKFRISRQAVYAHLAALVSQGLLAYDRPTTRAYTPGPKKQDAREVG